MSLAIQEPNREYNLLFRAVWQTVKQLGADPRRLGAQTGMIAVLHTWGSNLSLHPHLHCILLATRNRKTKLKDLQKSLGFRPPAGLQIPWQQRLHLLSGTNPDACPYCRSKTMLFLGYVPRQPTPGRSPPALLNIIVAPKAGPLSQA